MIFVVLDRMVMACDAVLATIRLCDQECKGIEDEEVGLWPEGERRLLSNDGAGGDT